MRQHHPVVIIGGGQAGLSASYYLKALGLPHLVLEKGRLGEAWRSQRWDTFCLVTPNFQCRLPGYPYSGPDPHGFMVKREIVEYLEGFRASFDPPLQEGVQVSAVTHSPLVGGFEVETSHGNFTADQVIVAIGNYHVPKIPAWAGELSPSIFQCHSSSYRNPESLPAGGVLVVGSGQSGCQIAEDLQLAGRQVHLALGDAPRSPRSYRGRDVVDWLEELGYYDKPIDQHPDPDMMRSKTNHYLTGRDGGREIDLRAFARDGMQLYGTLLAHEAGTLRFAPDLEGRLDHADEVYLGIQKLIDDYISERGLSAPTEPRYQPCWRPDRAPTQLQLARAGVSSVIWCIGFQHDFGFIEAPVFDRRGAPVHQRGVTSTPGLYFLGLNWLYTWGSARFCGVARDAQYVAQVAVERARLAERYGRRAASG